MDRRELKIDAKRPLREQLASFSDEDLQRVFLQANQWADFTKYDGMMRGIARDMREIPELPSEKIKRDDNTPLQRVEFPETGGVLTWMDGHDYPYKGYPFYEFVEKIDLLKKVSRALLSGLYHRVKRHNRLRFLTLIPAMWMLKDFAWAWVNVLYRIIERFRIKTVRYCTFVTELHRSFSIPIKGERAADRELREKLRDVLCMILEFDNAYRYRAQDALSELDVAAIAQHPGKELVRLLDLLSSRERVQEVRDTWKLFRYPLRFYLAFDPSLRRILRSGFGHLDHEKVKLSVEDKEFCIPRTDYTFGFTDYPDADTLRMLNLHRAKDNWKRERNRIEEESTEQHQAVKDREAKRKLDERYTKLLEHNDRVYEQAREHLSPSPSTT